MNKGFTLNFINMSAFKKLKRSRLTAQIELDSDPYLSSSSSQSSSCTGIYQCGLCGKRYDRAEDLVAHVEGGFHKKSECAQEVPVTRVSIIETDLRVNEAGNSLKEEWEESAREMIGDMLSCTFKRHYSVSPRAERFESILPFDDDHSDGHFQLTAIECPESLDEGDKPQSESEKKQPFYKCIKCNATFTSAVLLKNHRVVHALDCPKCGETFLIKPSLDRHLRERHGKEDSNKEDSTIQSTELDQTDYQPSQSHSKVAGPKAFASDVLIEPTADGWKCKMCPKVCQARSDMSKHVRRHTDERPFSCGICGDKFKHQSAITNHLRIHTGDKPFECVYCAKKFSQPSNKRRHEALHRGEKPFRCSICQRSFSEKTTLQTHYLQHTGERPFVCNQCGKGHVTNSALKQHKISRHRHEAHDMESVSSSNDDDSTMDLSIKIEN
ncbi:putative zinc finger protein [Orchesella cincta]|uniref:Putative zinc finger protein n=1 Tax=Orchesella cincta TaxID=48709 RepID=A0A1D2N3G1_ORCCI|nr:putative zinc finger protein [Orchesella cincta]